MDKLEFIGNVIGGTLFLAGLICLVYVIAGLVS